VLALPAGRINHHWAKGLSADGRRLSARTPRLSAWLYYEPRTPFVAGFVGANNRIEGRATRVADGIVELAGARGMTVRARAASSPIADDHAAAAFVRPEAIDLANEAGDLPPAAQRFDGVVESLLFDGANSAVLVRERQTRMEFRIALPQTGRYADLRVGEHIVFSFDPLRAVCFPAATSHA